MITVVQDRIQNVTNLALSRFERQFEYPLNDSLNFRICHGGDYLHFFRDLGKVVCFVAQSGSEVHGVLTTVARTIHIPGRKPKSVVYLCDLKVSPSTSARGLFLKLALRAKEYYRESATAAYGVVMSGTNRTPEKYAGAWGIPRFSELAETVILRIPVTATSQTTAELCDVGTAVQIFERLNSRCVHLTNRRSKTGSLYPPVALALPGQRAAGIVEDTLRCKRLVCQEQELISAHLSDLAYRSLADGAEIIRAAQHLCRQRNIPAIFLTLKDREEARSCKQDFFPNATITYASIYGLGLPRGLEWRINSSEI